MLLTLFCFLLFYVYKIFCFCFCFCQGHLIPAPADDKVGWIQVASTYNETRIGIDVAPADLTNGKVLLGSCDTVYLIFYALGLFISGHLADQMSLRIFLTVGMLGESFVSFSFRFPHSQTHLYFFSLPSSSVRNPDLLFTSSLSLLPPSL